MYSDITEYANHIVHSLITANGLLNERKTYEAFALLRTSFEAYLLLILLTRGGKFFRLYVKDTGKSASQTVNRVQSEITAGKWKHAIKASEFRGFVEIDFEGPYVDGKKSRRNLVPYYWSLIHQIDPIEAHLSGNGFLSYVPRSVADKKREKDFQKMHKSNFDFYLSFQAILRSLRLNGVSSQNKERRIRTHYNFLSTYVHINQHGIDSIKARNISGGRTTDLDSVRGVSDTSVELANLYCGYVLCGIITELVNMYEKASKYYVGRHDFTQTRAVMNQYETKFDYFWFIFNKPHEYDYYEYRTSRLWRNLSDINSNTFPAWQIPYYKNPYSRLKNVFIAKSNQMIGRYSPPRITN